MVEFGQITLSQIGGRLEGLSICETVFADFAKRLPSHVDQRLDQLQAQFSPLFGNGGGVEVRAVVLDPFSVQMSGVEELILGQKRLAADGKMEPVVTFVQCRTRIESLGPENLIPVYQITVDPSQGVFDLRTSCPQLFLGGDGNLCNQLLSSVRQWSIRPFNKATPTISLGFDSDGFYCLVERFIPQFC